MNCPKCKTKNVKTAKFCIECGVLLEEAASQININYSDIIDQWQDFMKIVRKEKPALSVLLAEAKLDEYKDKTILFHFKEGFNFHKDKLMNEKNKSIIEYMLEEFFHTNIKINAIVDEKQETVDDISVKEKTTKTVGKTCPYCHSVIKPSANLINCPECGTIHHKECWDENKGCAIYGCGAKKMEKITIENDEEENNTEDVNNYKMFKHPFSFDGRIRRLEYVLTYVIYTVLAVIVSALSEGSDGSAWAFLYIPMLWFLVAQDVKRCHDLGLSGWWIFMPIFNPFGLLFKAGQQQENEHGKPPKKYLNQNTTTSVEVLQDREISKVTKNYEKIWGVIGKIMSVFATPIMLLNFSSGVISIIWLAVIGKWDYIWYGILYAIFSNWILTIAMLPQLPLAGLTMYFLKEQKNQVLGYIFGYLSQVYTNVLILGTCAIAFSIVLSNYDNSFSWDLVAYLLWSWGIALGPWQYLASKETDNEFTMLNLFSISVLYLICIIGMIILPALSVITVILALIIHLIVFPIFSIYTSSIYMKYEK